MDTNSFTLIFHGNIRQFDGNPLKTETPFGVAFAASIGDAHEDVDKLREFLGHHGLEQDFDAWLSRTSKNAGSQDE